MRINFWKVGALAAVGATVTLLACGGPAAASPGSGQPNMEGAKSELQAAKVSLERAEHNKGGHRANAIRLVNEAINEVDQGIAYAEK